MNGSQPPNQLDETTRQRLARLADGSLGGRERAELEARIADSPDLRQAFERQREGMAALRDLEVEPSPALRTRIEAQRSSRRRPRVPRGWAVAGALAGAAATVAVLATTLLQTGSSAPNVVEASRLSTHPPIAQVAVDRSSPNLLAADVEGVPFPRWSKEFGWRQAGTRADRLGDRDARTVFYEHAGRRVAYTIVSGPGIHAPPASRPTTANGVHLHTLADGGRRVVTWWRDGRTCVLSSADASDRELVKLATWKGDGAVSF
jgi:hypothetical protein